MALAVYWPDGSVTRGASATDVLRKVADKQWDQPMTSNDLKVLLAARAYGWNQSRIDVCADDHEFLRLLGDSGMVFVTDAPVSWLSDV
jgi:hypothetical protein